MVVHAAFPLGIPVEFHCSDDRVLSVVQESYREWTKLFDVPPVHVYIDGIAGLASHPLTPPQYSRTDDSFTFADGYGNAAKFALWSGSKYAACVGQTISPADLWGAHSERAGHSAPSSTETQPHSSGETHGHIRVTAITLANPEWFRYHYLDSLILTALDSIYFTPIHAGCVARDGRAILLCGDSGAGKSSLSYACARAGWALTSDDSVHVAGGRSLLAVGDPWKLHLREPARALFPEIANAPVRTTPAGKRAIDVRACDVGVFTSPVAHITHTVFLRRRSGPPSLEVADPVATFDYFCKTLQWTDTSIHRENLKALCATSLWTLGYETPDDAILTLRSLVEPANTPRPVRAEAALPNRTTNAEP